MCLLADKVRLNMGMRSAIRRIMEASFGRPDARMSALEQEIADCRAELAETHARLNDYLETSSDWYWEQDADLRFTEMEAAKVEALPFLPLDYVGKTRWELNPGGYTAEERRELDEKARKRQPFEDFRCTRLNAEGGTVYVSISGKPIFGPDGAFLGYRGVGRDISCEVAARQTAIDEQKRFLESIESMEQGFALFDTSGQLKRWNSKFAALNSDCVSDMAIGAPIDAFAVVMPDASTEVAPADPFERQGRWLVRTETTQSSGETVLVDVDVSELKAREAELAVRETQFRDFAELSADWFWELDKDLCFSFMSKSYQQLGGAPEDVIGMDRGNIRPPFMKDAAEDPEPEYYRRRESFRNVEHQSVFHEGAWVSTSAKPLYDAAGVFIGYRGITRNITEQRRLVQRMADERAAYHDMLDAAPVGFLLVDADGNLVFANDLQAKRWRFDAKASVGKCMFDLLSPEIASWSRQRNAEVVASNKPMPFVQREFATLDGLRNVVISKIPIALPNHERTAVCTITADITARVRAQRSRHEAELKLAQAQRLESVGQLTGGVAHDFNNILSIIIGASELLGPMVRGNVEAERLLDGVERSATRGADLVDRLLSYARQQPMMATTVEAADVIQQVEVLLRRAIGESIRLEIQAPADVWPVYADRSQFENAVMNLALNARDAMPDGGVLTIETENAVVDQAHAAPDEDFLPGDYVRIAVADTGAGISAGTLPHIFDPFFTTKDVGKGSGLGLSMVYGFAKQSGGHVVVESKPGEGARIAVYLPRALEEVVETEARSGGPAEAQTNAARVLVVEDDAQLRALPVNMLSSKGYHVTAAADGREALKAAKDDGPFDLLFTDIVLPGGMNGVDIADALQATDPALKVLFTTGYADLAGDELSVKRPGAKVVGKPYRMAELLAAVEETLQRSP